MPKYDQMISIFNEYSKNAGNLFRQHPKNEAYKTVSLKNKKLYFKIIINLIVDLYEVNNQNTDEILIKNYFDELTKKGESLDSIPDNYDEVSKLSDKKYFENIAICSKIQGEMLRLLSIEIESLGKYNH